MTPFILLGLYSVALAASSLLGGRLPSYFAMTHTRTQLAMSFVSGVMLGIAFLHLLPHALAASRGEHGISTTMTWTLFGLVIMLLLLRLLHFHQPDYPGQPSSCHHDHADDVVAVDAASPVGWRGVLVGLVFHTFIDGMALGAAMVGAPYGQEGTILGLGIFIAILLHKPLDAMSITALMKAGGAAQTVQRLANLVFALVCPIGAVAVYLLLAGAGELRDVTLAPMLAFSAGAFICIALGDLLPEVQFHSHDRIKLTLMFLLGIGIAYLIEWASPQHSHTLGGVAGLA
jgi:zinc and cadmium transporter